MKTIRMKGIFTADFRRSPRTLVDDLRRKRNLWQGEPNEGEAYVFVSSRGNQIVFVTGDKEIEYRAGTRYEAGRRLLDYRCWRIEGGSFSVLMLENYANAVGLSLGKKRLEAWYQERLQSRRE